MHPALRRQLLTYVSQGKSDNQIAKLCKVSRDTLRAFRQREAETISQRKQTILATFMRIAEAGSEAIEAELAEGKVKGALLVPVTGMAVDKILALTSDPQQIQVTHFHEPGPNLYKRMEELAASFRTQSGQGSEVHAQQTPSPPLETQTNTAIEARLNGEGETLDGPDAVRALPSP